MSACIDHQGSSGVAVLLVVGGYVGILHDGSERTWHDIGIDVELAEEGVKVDVAICIGSTADQQDPRCRSDDTC